MGLEEYRQLVRDAESSEEYWKDVVVSDFARELHELMAHRGVRNAELARRLGVKRQFITKLLGGANVTLTTMVRLAMALNAVVRVNLERKEDRAKQEPEYGVVYDFYGHHRAPRVNATAGADTSTAEAAWGRR